jgi:hypothetical protein
MKLLKSHPCSNEVDLEQLGKEVSLEHKVGVSRSSIGTSKKEQQRLQRDTFIHELRHVHQVSLKAIATQLRMSTSRVWNILQ